ncbi:PPOX class F420-dependent oxidoreductase [Kitasatospora sp. CM 4170]|uniref:PPOX class F420-dependent oxidoreductase n=1 Tax=Kitasatospora TaxID=2063 RepID=UPI0028AF8A61|nr:PPOX class F420-dependent oxidoreductase [Kitasatospora sp. CM 4170]WNM45076.1 PPOX class F420-dependent oxidoreductase [Kitasatospora sp. CM 4170]
MDENGVAHPAGALTRTRACPSRAPHGDGSRWRHRGHRPPPTAPDVEREDIVHHRTDDRTDDLADSRYLLLTTFGDDGSRVESQSWVVADGTALGIWTTTHSDEAERIRRHPRVLVGPCDSHGRPTGRPVPARAAVCDADATARYRISLLNKYGMSALIALARSRLRLGLAGTVGIRITINELEPRLIGPEWPPPTTYCPN